MRKRLRKKKHLGEFMVLGVEVLIRFNSKDDHDIFYPAFITEAIEANNCYFGGGGTDDSMEGFIELGRVPDDPSSRLKAIIKWIDSRTDVSTYHIGHMTDAWYGPF